MTEGLGIPPEFFEQLKPELVTPAVLYLASEQAPTGVILEAGAGYFAKAHIVEGRGAKLGQTATVEDVARRWEEISDMGQATPLAKGSDVTRKIFT
ncbi:MAG: hypothetical protein RL385_1260 [Pseudomonadota bacterium]|jgi:hypothetical protein